MRASLTVALPGREYDIFIERGILGKAGESIRAVLPKAGRLAVVTDTNVAPLYADAVLDSLSAAGYQCRLFTVPAGSTLTLDGGLIVDGNNNWVMDKAAYEKDLNNMVQVPKDDCEKYFTFIDGETKATEFMITNAGGTVNLNSVTIQNNYSYNSGVVKVTAANAITNLKGATVTHVASATGNGVVVHSNYASTITVDGETLITKNHVGGNHGLFKIYSGAKVVMNGGEITNTTGWNSNGVVAGIYGSAQLVCF